MEGGLLREGIGVWEMDSGEDGERGQHGKGGEGYNTEGRKRVCVSE